MAKTKYQTLKATKARYCKDKGRGATKMTQVNKAKSEYITDAVKKGKTKPQAEKIANKVLNAKCATTPGTKKKTTKKKSAAKKRKAK